MNKITVIVLKKAQETIADILALDSSTEAAGDTVMTWAQLTDRNLSRIVNGPAPAPAPPVTEAPPAHKPDGVLDSEGLPWDARIHSSGKTFLAKGGTWKLARGIDPLLVAQVKTELSGGPPITPCAPAPAPAPPEDTGLTWAQLMEKIADAGTASDDVLAACQMFNVQGMAALQDMPVLVPLVAKELRL